MARKRKTAEKGSKDDCRGNPGKVIPVIDRNLCVDACPEDALVLAAVR
ncbi:MAG: hypothetical protein H8E63_09285 [Proteobacteria bacterium]|nr:hypothetical protein [Pseudomonadota bacterium]